jgi:hypothetical protein
MILRTIIGRRTSTCMVATSVALMLCRLFPFLPEDQFGKAAESLKARVGLIAPFSITVGRDLGFEFSWLLAWSLRALRTCQNVYHLSVPY